MRFKQIVLLFSLLGSSIPAHAALPLWVDLADLVQYSPSLASDASLIQSYFKAHHSEINPDSAAMAAGMTIQKSTDSGRESIYEATARMEVPQKGGVFRRYEIHAAGNPRAITQFKILQDTPLSAVHFTISVGLVQRSLLVEDVADDIRMVFPIGDGAIDEGVMMPGQRTILTPLFHDATLRKRTILPSVTAPAYYRNQPFMPITTTRGSTTSVAFHITILSDSDWNQRGPNYLVRGFDSHGCMRMREKDLQDLFGMVMKTPGDRVPVEVDYFILKKDSSGQPNDKLGYVPAWHPYPLRMHGYQRVKNFAAPGQPPVAQRDPVEHLIILEQVHTPPVLDGLKGFDANDENDLKDYMRLVRGH